MGVTVERPPLMVAGVTLPLFYFDPLGFAKEGDREGATPWCRQLPELKGSSATQLFGVSFGSSLWEPQSLTVFSVPNHAQEL